MSTEQEAEGIDRYVRHLEAQAVGDWALAAQLLREAVALGEPMALHAAAFRETNPDEALRLYTAAADGGFAASAWNLYLHFAEQGDRDAARLWLERAAELGDEDAVKALREN